MNTNMCLEEKQRIVLTIGDGVRWIFPSETWRDITLYLVFPFGIYDDVKYPLDIDIEPVSCDEVL